MWLDLIFWLQLYSNCEKFESCPALAPVLAKILNSDSSLSPVQLASWNGLFIPRKHWFIHEIELRILLQFWNKSRLQIYSDSDQKR